VRDRLEHDPTAPAVRSGPPAALYSLLFDGYADAVLVADGAGSAFRPEKFRLRVRVGGAEGEGQGKYCQVHARSFRGMRGNEVELTGLRREGNVALCSLLLERFLVEHSASPRANRAVR